MAKFVQDRAVLVIKSDPKVIQKTPFRCYFLQVSVKPRHPERDGSQVGCFFTFLKGLALDPLQSGMHRGGLSAAHQGWKRRAPNNHEDPS